VADKGVGLEREGVAMAVTSHQIRCFLQVLVLGILVSCGGSGVQSSGAGGGFNKGGNKGGNNGGNKGGNKGGNNGGNSYPTEGTKVIGVWAIEDSFPVSGTVYPGVSAYHENGIERVEFYLDSKKIGEATEEEINPSTKDPEFFIRIDTSALKDGDYELIAKIIPKQRENRKGAFRELSPLSLRVRNKGPNRKFYLDHVNGLDANPGTQAKPWKTWAHAEAATRGGDQIWVRSGNYKVVVDKNQNDRNSWKEWITVPGQKVVGKIQGAQILTPFLSFEGVNFLVDAGYAFKGIGVSHVVFRSCSFYVDPKLEVGVFIVGTVDSLGKGIRFLEFTDCKFTGARKAFSFVTTTKEPNEIQSAHRFNLFRGLELDQVNDGWMIDARDSLWEDIVGHNNQRTTNDHCDFFQFIWGKSSNLIMRDIRLFASGTKNTGMTFLIQTNDSQISDVAILNAAVQVYKEGSHILYLAPNSTGSADHLCVVNTTILSVTPNSTGLIVLSNKLSNSVIGNNILASLAAYPTENLTNSKNTDFDYNSLLKNWGGMKAWGMPHSFLVQDPKIQNPSQGDFSLKTGSPCVNQGNPVIAPRFDLNHSLRKDGRPDLGALEH